MKPPATRESSRTAAVEHSNAASLELAESPQPVVDTVARLEDVEPPQGDVPRSQRGKRLGGREQPPSFPASGCAAECRHA